MRRRRTGDFARTGVYLKELASKFEVGPGLSVSHSDGAKRRAGQLSAWLAGLQQTAMREFEPAGSVRLVVANARDWRRLCAYPYGLPFTRNEVGTANVVVAADYPERLLHRFEASLLGAGHAGVLPPGPLNEFLDLLVGHEWGHAFANVSGLRTYLRWLDELLATYLFVQASRDNGQQQGVELLRRWADLQVAAGSAAAGSVAANRDVVEGTPSGLSAGWPLDGFEYPRGRTPMPRMLWYQGVFTHRALEVSAERGWSFARELASVLPSADRGELARSLVAIEPSFRSWFAVFGDSAGDATADAGDAA